MRVAIDKIKITPKKLIGTPLAGYTRKEPCRGKWDDIHAYGVLIESNGSSSSDQYLLLLSLDLLKIPLSLANYMKRQLINHYSELKEENILIHATHTHAAPDLTGEFYWPGGTLNVMKGIMFGVNRNDKYLVWLTKKINQLVQRLLNNLIPCKIAWKKEQFNPKLVINRRHPTRPVKPDLGVIVFKHIDDGDKIIGLIVNFACHPTTLPHSNNKLSADYPGRIVQKIEESSNQEIKAVYFNGPSGDLNPITTCGTDFKALEKDKSKIYNQHGTYQDTIRIGSTIAERALTLAKSIPEELYFEEITFTSHLKSIEVPLRDVNYFSPAWYSNKLYHVLKKILLIPLARSHDANFPAFTIHHEFRNIHAQTILQYIELTASSKKNSILKKFSIFTVPGELFEEIGLNLLKHSPLGKDNSFLFQNSNDWIAYLFPIHEYVNVGGYEPIASFSPISGDVIHQEMLFLFKTITKTQ